MSNLPTVKDANELRTLDIAGLNEQLGLAQQAIEILQEQKKAKFDELITAQNTLLDSQKKTHQIKIEIKDITNNNNKYLERIKVIKTMIRGEKD